jgi:hypothetical protein
MVQKKEDEKALTVTEGNIAFDKDGKRRLAGDAIALTAEQAKELKAKKIVE